jgi:predicted Zn finger-like uncharacterized protein
MEITCPHCGFSRDVDPARVPDQPVNVKCPRCADSFSFDKRAVAEETPPREQELSPEPAPAAGRPEPGEHLTAIRHETQALTNTDDLPKAGFWVRFIAYGIDGAIVSIVQIVLGFLFGYVLSMGDAFSDEGHVALSVVSGLLGIVISLAYGVFFIGYCGQTPGKMALRIKVIRTRGDEMSYGRAALREILGKFVSGILLCIGYLMVAFDSQKQGLHDKIADTYVIKL